MIAALRPQRARDRGPRERAVLDDEPGDELLTAGGQHDVAAVAQDPEVVEHLDSKTWDGLG